MSGNHNAHGYGQGQHYQQQPYQQPYQQQAYGPPPGYPPPAPPRGRNVKKLVGWIAVVVTGAATTAFATLLVNKDDDKKPEAASSVAPQVQSLPKTAPSFDPNAKVDQPTATAVAADKTPPAPPAPMKGGKFAIDPLDVKTWPDACALLPLADVQKVVPETTAIDVRGVAEPKMVGTSWDKTPTLRSTTCDVSVQSGLNFGGAELKLTVTIINITDPTAVQRQTKYDRDLAKSGRGFKELGPESGADVAFLNYDSAELGKGVAMVRVQSSGTNKLYKPGGVELWDSWLPDLMPKFVPLIAAKL